MSSDERIGRRKEDSEGKVTWISQKEWKEEQSKAQALNPQQSSFAFCLDDSEKKSKIKIMSPILVEVIKMIVPLSFFESTSDGVSFEEPYAHLFQYSKDIRKELESRVGANSDHLRDFRALEAFLESHAGYGIIWKSLDRGNRTVVGFDDIWALFRAGELMVVQDRLEEKRLFKFTRLQDSIKEVGFQKELCVAVEVHFWYIVWSPGKKRFRQKSLYFEIKRFAGHRKVTSLPVYPLRYEDEDTRQSLLMKLQTRGKKWADLISDPPSCFEYSGHAIPESESRGRENPNFTHVSLSSFLNSSLHLIRRNIAGRAHHPGPEGFHVHFWCFRRH